ncbi:hypothetical protein NCF85_11210 [Qipengyuania citrea]|jgi:hypothetical protein|uniref:Uncharacterized protein n=2 Tax=Qipengyuania TaxID=1855416 RepID=A0ABY4U3I3_9SPHN|nr:MULTISPECIES: hypothetical protein [Qipengyuania]MAB45650.1 hypothetical protein [Sphingomonadaceae bacterium]MBL4895492.1 hypothetical protein [Erythrobacter sp.]QPL40924.1 hypothetical protein IT881_06930 [Erythrobacter sp. A30-3]HIN66694.1 hypothetical protein [Candidatus Obscuribacterales bacterium]MBX7489547.1 hypothetical protein [Qipengyuania aerophila]|tara:strand:- start:822 stop:1088 length:267 start_codon:yes stop_codon:yes gene_type:complete
MKKRLQQLAEHAQQVADCANRAIESSSAATEMNALNDAMMAYRSAAVFYLTHPSIADYVRADARKHSPETREAIERIADLIDRLNEPD